MSESLFDALSAWGDIEWGRGNETGPRPPFFTWRFVEDDSDMYEALAGVVSEFAGSVEWGMYKGGRNWVIEPRAVSEFANGGDFRTDVEMSDAFAASHGDVAAKATGDVPGLADHIRRSLPT